MKDYRDVIIRPIITEKSMKAMAEDNKYTFEVAKGTNKIEIRQAVEAIWNVKVEKVNTSNSKQRTRRVGRYMGKVPAVHKAVVKLKEGYSIDIFGSEE
ncbi:50S ribosomal protein L23 [Floccifex sp.]|uniref:50S ribosomal protein L23 n=1 Tax=Floccifex sp. TaxID=2815810 RepID=UPI003F04F375|nr:50S ribosomal protein L23 [Erysipelotrichaceae bacterium]